MQITLNLHSLKRILMSTQAGELLKKILNHLKLSAKILEGSDIN